MANPLFSALGGGNNMTQMLNELKQNALGMLQKTGFNVPANINNPQDIVMYLIQSGQINQNQLNQAQQRAQMFGNIK